MKLLDDKQISKKFFNEYIGARGPKGWISRYISNTGRWYTDMLMEQAKIKPDDVILDVGCGSATTIVSLLKKIPLNHPVHGIEPSEIQLQLAEKNLSRADLTDKAILQQGFASPLSYKADQFDVVYNSFIIKHFGDSTLADFFQEAYRVLKPGGRFLGWEFAQVYSPFVKKVARDWHFRNFSQIESFLKKAGFQNIVEFEVPNRGFWDQVKDVGFKAEKQ